MRTAPIVTAIICSVVCAIIGLFALLNNYRRRANWLTFIITILVAAALPVQSVLEYTDPSRIVLWARIDTGSTMIVDALLLFLACNFPRRLFGRRAEIFYWIISSALVVISFTPLMVVSGTSDGEVVKLTTGALMPLYYAADTIYALLVIPALIVQYRRGRAMDKLRIKYLLIGAGGITITLSVIGLWLPIFFHIYHTVDYVPYVILLGLSLLVYDVVALRLFSIRLVVAKSAAYVLLLLFMAGGYYVLALWVGQKVLGMAELSQFDQAYQIAVALVLAFLFQPVRGFFEKLTNKIFYREHYDTQKVVNKFSNILVSERDIEPLLRHSLDFLCNQLHIGSGQIMIYDQGRPFASAGYNRLAQPSSLGAIADLQRLPKSIVVSEDLTDDDSTRLAMDKADARVMIKLISQKENVGILLLGDKLSGDIYSNQDIGTLQIVCQELAVAVQNSRAYRQLQDAQAKLKKTDEMKSEFIALSSHNLRTPIATIGMITELLGSSKSPQETSKYINMLSGVSSELSGFVEELLIISSLEAGEKYTSFEIVTAEDLLQPLTAQAELECNNKGIKFGLTFQDPELHVRANTAHLRIVMRSLLENAVKFTESGGISVTVAKASDQCVITITDTGVGIKDEELKNLFTKFHRGTDLMRYDFGGAGVGLYLAKLVIEEHGGQIAVVSHLGQGTTVTVNLPLASS
jgi:signal transduction histidine kinase